MKRKIYFCDYYYIRSLNLIRLLKHNKNGMFSFYKRSLQIHPNNIEWVGMQGLVKKAEKWLRPLYENMMFMTHCQEAMLFKFQ